MKRTSPPSSTGKEW